MKELINIDLLTVGVSVAGAIIFGFLIYLNNKRSATNKTFFLFSIASSCWGIANYVSYQLTSPNNTLISIRIVIFFAVIQSFYFFKLIYLFPKEYHEKTNFYKKVTVPITIVTAVLTLTPLVFKEVRVAAYIGQPSQPVVGPAISLFILTAVSLVLSGLVILLKKMTIEKDRLQKTQFRYLFVGASIMFLLIIFFNLFFPIFWQSTRFIPLGAVFILPFIFSTSYAIYRHKLFNLRIVTTAALAFLITVFSFSNILFAENTVGKVVNSAAFVVILLGSIRLVREMLNLEIAKERAIELSNQLDVTNIHLKEMDQAKSEFLSIASHQLRTPVSVIKGYLSLIMEGAYGKVNNPTVEQKIKQLFITNERLVTLINNLLNVSRIEKNKLEYICMNFDVMALLEQIMVEMTLKAKEKGLGLQLIPTTKKIPTMFIDKDKLHEILGNLVDNAIKYSVKGKIEITVDFDEAKKEVFVYIKDQGVGMTRETADHLFEKFYRGETPGMPRETGTGLGLFICSKFAKDMGGRVWVYKTEPGIGTTFAVAMPVEPKGECLRHLEAAKEQSPTLAA